MVRRNHNNHNRVITNRRRSNNASLVAHPSSHESRESSNNSSDSERTFWILSCCIIVIWIMVRVFDFSLLPLSYNGLYINKPFNGLHSWHFASQAWTARSHAVYGLSYTKGYRTLVVGHPPPEQPLRYVSHPPLETIISALGILVLGSQEWAIRLFELILSIPALFLIIYILSRLFDSSIALVSGLLLVIIPIFAFFVFDFMLVLMALWALYRYLILTGGLKNGSAPRKRHFLELAIALFLVIQFGWAGVFYAFAIGLHYVVSSLIRRLISWRVLAVLAIAPLLSIALNFYVMISGFQSNIKVETAEIASTENEPSNEQNKTAWSLMKTLYQWRAREGELETFIWKDWVVNNAGFALTNFTWPVLILLAAYFVYLTVAFIIYLSKKVSKGRYYPVHIHRFYNHLWFFLFPGVLFIFTFKGLFWRHQYWQSPLTLFVVIGATLSLFLIGDFFGTVGRWPGRIAIAVFFIPIVLYCNKELAAYREILWQSPLTINLFKELNQQIPPDKALLTFKDLNVEQSEAKAIMYRPEYAWYLDRDMIVANAWQVDKSLPWKVQIVDIVSETIREIQKQADTGRFPYYFIPERNSHLPDPGTLEKNFDREELSKIEIIDMDRRLNDADYSDDEALYFEKFRRYQELLLRKLKKLYNYKYYSNFAQYGSKDYCYSGNTPCYLFDLTNPK